MTHHATNRRNVTIAVMVATFLTALDGTVVSTAMPTIVSDLGGIQLISWVFAVYLLTTSVTTPIWGKLADLFGRKLVFTLGTSLFLIGSILSGMSANMDQLIWFRAFQGIGAGAVFPITLTIIGDIYTFEERARIQGLFGAIWGISGILGPLIGGFFVDWLTWRWIFYINLPIGLASMVLVWIFLREHFERKPHKIDYWGAITFSIGTTSLLYALLTGGVQHAWNSPIIIGLFVVAVVFLVAFVFIQARTAEPMLPLMLFTERVIVISNASSFLSSAILIGITVYLPLWIQGILGHTATSAGLTLTPMSIGWPIGSAIGGRIMLKIGSRTTAAIGLVALFAGSLWLTFVDINASQWVMIVIMVVVGFGFGFSTTAFTVVIQSSVGWNMRGVATASNQLVRSLGQTIGIAVFGTVFNQVVSRSASQVFHSSQGFNSTSLSKYINPEVAKRVPAPFLHQVHVVLVTGLHTIYVWMAFISVGALLIGIWLPQMRSQRDAKDAQKQTQPAN